MTRQPILKGFIVTAKITLTWDNGSSEHVDQIVYRSAETFTVDNLPTILARVGRNAREYIDTDIVTGNTYFYAVASENAAGEILLSSVISVTAESSDGDPHWDNVVSLMHFDDGLYDETGKVFSGGLNATGGKLVANGSAFIDCYHNDFIFGNSDFTIESLVTVTDTPNSSAGYGTILNKSPNSPDSNYALYARYISGVYSFEFLGTGPLSNGIMTNEIQPNVEYHVAVVRNGADISIYVDGVFQQSMDVGVSALTNSSGPMRIGTFSFSSYTHGFRGTVDELRITKGVARYTENFTPPTEPFPNFQEINI